jgi:hypothetical protein
MAENNDTSPKDSTINVAYKGMMKDFVDGFVPEGVWTHAMNAVKATLLGKKGGISNEQSNRFSNDIGLEIFHVKPLYESKYVVFSTDNQKIHEIGIFNEDTLEYKAVLRSECFAFNTKYALTSAVRRRLNDLYVYWQHKPGPDRVLNLSDIPYKTIDRIEDGCKIEVPTNELDCVKTLLAPLVNVPSIKAREGNGGQLPNGLYQASIAYSNDGIRETDYMATSLPATLWSIAKANSLEVVFDGLDTSYDEFELVVVTKIAGQTVAKAIGTYSTATKVVNLDAILASAQTVPLAFIYTQTLKYPSSEKMHSLNGYLIRSGVTAHIDPNYQLLANKIESRWVEVKQPESYYAGGGQNIGHMRDEVYPYFIRWVYNTGAKTASYHIPGRVGAASDFERLSENVYANADKTWEVRDTSTRNTPGTINPGDYNTGGVTGGDIGTATSYVTKDTDGGEVVATGKMQYWQSSEKYPDNKPEIWGDLCGKNIRHHKFPSNATSPHFSKSQGKRYIHILGLKFINIEHPVDRDGNRIDNIVGYEILRGSRQGNKSIIAKGMFNTTLNYYNPEEKINGVIQNFPFNSLRPNRFLRNSILETHNYDPIGGALDSYNRNRLSFHSPDTSFQRPIIGGIRVRKYMDIVGTTKGEFAEAHEHPEQKLLSAKWTKLLSFITLTSAISAAVGGQTSSAELSLSPLGLGLDTNYSRDDGPITTPVSFGLGSLKLIPSGAMSIVMFGANYSMWAKFGFATAYNFIEKMLKYKQYAYQYNGHCLYDEPVASKAMLQNLNTNSSETKYISSGIQDINDDLRMNNIFRNGFLHVALTKNMTDPLVQDTSGKTLGEYGKIMSINYNTGEKLEEQSSSNYGALIVEYENQYGQISSIKQVPCHSGVFASTGYSSTFPQGTDILFGGDTYISKYSEKNPYLFFNAWQMGQTKGSDFNYKNYVNGPAPRYWADFTPVNPDDVVFKLGKAITDITLDLNRQSTMYGYPSKYHLESSPAQRVVETGEPWNVNQVYEYDDEDDYVAQAEIYRELNDFKPKRNGTVQGAFYLSVNGIREFFVESEFNMDYREDGEKNTEKFWGEKSSTVFDNFFRMDRITSGNFFRYDNSLLPNQFYSAYTSVGFVLSPDYDPVTDEKENSFYPLRSIYSLQQSSDLKRDNWKIYLANNYKDFESPLNNIKSMNKVGALILFEDSEPQEMIGQDTLQTDGGVKVTIGDGGLFQQQLRSPANADDVNAYGACNSHDSAVNTPFGLFYVSEKNGKIMKYASGLGELRAGMSRFIENYVPLQIRKAFPNFNNYDNLPGGAGWSTVYDQQYETIYFIKRDYRLKKGVKDLKYDPVTRRFYLAPSDLDEDLQTLSNFNNNIDKSQTNKPGENPDFLFEDIKANLLKEVRAIGATDLNEILLGDPDYFEDVSFTLSYDPAADSFISFHRWTPTYAFNARNHFFTIEKTSFWKHNVSKDSFCNFFGRNYEFLVELPEVTGNAVTTLSSIEYSLDNYIYNGEFQIQSSATLNHNFDRALLYNDTQSTGWLKLTEKPKNNPVQALSYPRLNTGLFYEILYSREENKYKFNQFWDLTRDAGVFSNSQTSMFTGSNPSLRELNSDYFDLSKPTLQRQKLRSQENRILLKRTISANVNMVLNFVEIKKVLSQR